MTLATRIRSLKRFREAEKKQIQTEQPQTQQDPVRIRNTGFRTVFSEPFFIFYCLNEDVTLLPHTRRHVREPVPQPHLNITIFNNLPPSSKSDVPSPLLSPLYTLRHVCELVTKPHLVLHSA